MKAFSFLSARLDLLGLCLTAALATACSSNARGLHALSPPAPDGAVENPAVSDAGPSSIDGNTASPADAPAPTGADAGKAGAGGGAGTAGTRGAGGTAGTGGGASSGGTIGAAGIGGAGGIGGIAAVGGFTTKPAGSTAGSSGGSPGAPDAGISLSVLSIDKVSVGFGSVDVGAISAAQVVTVSNTGSKQAAIMPTITGSGSFLITDTCASIPAASSCNIIVIFQPTAVGNVSGVLSISSTLTVSLSGSGVPQGSFSMTGVDLGNKVTTNASVPGSVTVTVTGTVTDLSCSVSGADLTFDPTKVCPAALAAGTSCTVGFTFKATTAGSKIDSVVCSAAGLTKTAAVTATVFDPAKLAITPPTASFQTQIGTQSPPVTFGVANTGGMATGQISATITGTNAEQFVITVPGCLAPLVGATGCALQVACLPTSVGTKSATLKVADVSGAATSVSAALTCVSIGPATLTVTGTTNLGSVAIGSTGTPQTFTVKDTGATASGTLSVTISDPQFVKGSDTCTGTSLDTGASCTVVVSLHPTAPGSLNAILNVTAASGNPGFIQLSGIGLPGAWPPAGFANVTNGTVGAYALGPQIASPADGGAGGSAGTSIPPCSALFGVVRDFKMGNQPGGHPDFETAPVGDDPGIVASTLGADGKPVYATTARQPLKSTTGPDNFYQWYHDAPGVNIPFVLALHMVDVSGTASFQATQPNSFFPLDNAGFGNQGQVHNYSFTTEIHSSFQYKEGETFSFSGDDDVWVFINNQLVIDLGGRHAQETKLVPIDSLGLTKGNVYGFALFHAERHTDQSNFQIQSTLSFTNCGEVNGVAY